MTQDEIIEMARQAGMDYLQYLSPEAFEKVVVFAKLIAEHEREACAKTCEQITNDMSKWHSAYLGVTSETKFIRKTGEIIAEPFIQAIRARK
jgi:hypothetical protein